jgi:SAM-dependent methyltransferase
MTDSDRVFELEETLSSWDRLYYPPVAQPFFDRAVADMLRVMRVPNAGRVLDAGCGTGVHSVRAARLGARPVAVDISATMLDEARRRAELAGVADAIAFGQEDMRELSFDDASFPHVFSWGVVIHIREVEDAFRELVRVLEPGGTLALWITNRAAFDHPIERFARSVTRRLDTGQVQLPLGFGTDQPVHGESLWTWQFDIVAVIAWLESMTGLRLIHRHIGALTGLQRRLPERTRAPLLLANRWAYRAALPARLGATNMLVFEKRV